MLTVTRRLLISAPKDSVRDYLRDLRKMKEYAPKIDGLEVSHAADSGVAQIEAQGKFFRLPWRGSFKVEFTSDGGYRREMVRGPLPRLTGGFHLRAVTGGTLITQEQQVQLPLPLKPFAFLWRRWLDSSMDRELHVIKEGAELLNRQLQLKRIESVA